VIAAALIAAACTVTSPAHTVAVVELYTSQGCSSCPPADRWLSRLPADDRVVPLALHVGYWDYIGWKDPFSKPEFGARQSQLVRANQQRTVYTPHVFLQGREMRRWPESNSFDAALKTLIAQPARAQVTLTANLNGRALTVEAKAGGLGSNPGDGQLIVALVHSGHRTAVKAGENRGENLHNDHVVREWSGPLPLTGAPALTWKLPEGAHADSLRLIAFVQDRATGAPVQAVSTSLAACAK
jgi:hypothetical protein